MEKLIKKYDRTPIRANTHVLQDLKIALDDILVNLLKNEFNIQQDHRITDLRIVIGFISIISAIYITYVSLYGDFKEYKQMSLILTLVYFVLNSFITFIMKFINKGCVFKARDNSIRVYTTVVPPNTNYIVMVYRRGIIPEKYNKNVCDLFDEEGRCLHEVFMKDLKNFFTVDGKKNK